MFFYNGILPCVERAAMKCSLKKNAVFFLGGYRRISLNIVPPAKVSDDLQPVVPRVRRSSTESEGQRRNILAETVQSSRGIFVFRAPPNPSLYYIQVILSKKRVSSCEGVNQAHMLF